MSFSTIFINIFRWLLLLLVQIFLLRNLSFYNLPIPFLYVLFILLLPFSTPNFLLYILAFATGFTLDAFYDTIGVHTSACVALAFARIQVINISLNKDSIDEPEPSLGNMGIKWFAFYALFCILVHHLFLFFLEAFKFSGFFFTLGRTLLSVLFTLFLVILAEYLFQSKKSV